MNRVTAGPERVIAESNYIREEIEASRKKLAEEKEKKAIAPELEAGTWLNSDAKSLREFRGKYVLLDFWFIGCGPCERAFPNLKLVHEKFHDRGFSVIGVHIAGQTPETVRQFTDSHQLSYPTVVDAINEPILQAYKPFGVKSFPAYILIDPEGNVVNDFFFHGKMLETIRYLMLQVNGEEHGK